MTDNQMIIDEDYCKEMNNYYIQQAEFLNLFIIQYIEILKETKTKALVSGSVATAMAIYISHVELLQNQIRNITYDIDNDIGNFIRQVESEDTITF